MNSPMTNTGSAADQVLVFPPDRGIGVLAVDPPYPLGFKPQNDGALGININMVYGDRSGLLVYILAYINMSVGDHIRVFIETSNVPVAEFAVTEAHFDAQGQAKNIPFNISPRDMEARFEPLKNQNKDFWFEVRRVSGNTEESPRVPLFYKHPAPGEADTDGGKPFNQGLKLPLASESFVDQSVINDGMSVTVPAYYKQSIDDVVVLAFGSLTLETTVSALGDVIFELSPERLTTLAPTNNLIVRWQTFDVVENSSGWSDSLVLPFKPGIVLLTAPIFEQADPDNVLHHDQLNDAPATVLITGVFAANDQIELTLEGLTKGGDPVSHSDIRTLSSATRSLSFALENERVRNLIGGSLRASYTLTRAGKIQRSKPADVTINGISLMLGLPALDPLVDDKLPADTTEATVRVADYWPLKRGATVELWWQTTDPAGIVALFGFRQIITDPTQAVIFRVPAQYIAPYANTPLTLQNTISNPGELRVPSELLLLMIGEVAKIELQPPTLVEPALNPIDVLAYPNGVTVRIEYLGALEGDRARLVELDSPAGAPPFPLVAFNSNKQVNTALTRAFLAARQGKELELCWSLSRDNAQIGESTVVKLLVLKIAESDGRLPTPVIPEARGTNILDLNVFTGNASVTVKSLPPLLTEGQKIWLSAISDTRTIQIAAGDNVSPSEALNGLSRIVSRGELEALEHNRQLEVKLKVNFRGEANEATATAFPSTFYTVRTTPAYWIENFSGQPNRYIAVGQNISINGMTITLTNGTNLSGIHTYNYPVAGMLEGPAIVTNLAVSDDLTVQQNITLTLRAGCSRVRFAYTYQIKPAEVIFSGSAGALKQINLLKQSSQQHHWVDFSGPAGVKITTIDIISRDWSYLDHFQFWS